MKLSNIQLLLLRLVIGGLFLSLGLEKIHGGWLSNSQPLAASLQSYASHAGTYQAKYLNFVAVPYVSLWAKLMAVGETAIGASLLLGLLVRLSAIVGIFMVLNFHAATGNLYSLSFFGSPWAGLLVIGLLVLLLARAGRWAGIDALLARSNTKGMLW